MNKKKYLIILVTCFLFIVGCSEAVKDATYKTITADEAKVELDKDSNIVLLDVRTNAEYDEEHIPGSILIPLNELATSIISEIPDKGTKIFIYCKSGGRSKSASQMLADLGYTNVYDLGGIDSWKYETE